MCVYVCALALGPDVQSLHTISSLIGSDSALPGLRRLYGTDRQRRRPPRVLQRPVAQPGEGCLLHWLHLLLVWVVPQCHAKPQGEAEDWITYSKTLVSYAVMCTCPKALVQEETQRWPKTRTKEQWTLLVLCLHWRHPHWVFLGGSAVYVFFLIFFLIFFVC